ncbi:unnamed protein product [Ectocarpus sp. 12 AP-2014]
MALWQSFEDLFGDNQLEVCTYRVKLKALAWSDPAECGPHQLSCGEIVRTPGGLVCVFFRNRGASSGAERLSRESQVFPGRLFVSHSIYTNPLLVSQGTYAEAEPLYGK